MTPLADLRREYRPLLELAVPLVLGELGWMTMGIVDTIVVGRLNKEALGAVSLGGILFFTVAVLGMGVLLGLDTLVSQAFGAGRMDDCHHSLLNALYVSIAMTPPLMGLIWCWTLLLPRLGVQPDVLREFGPYIGALTWSVLPLLAYTAMRRYLQGMSLVKPVLFSLISANLVNLVGNWALVFGHLGFPAWGTAGSGWATCISRIYMTAVLAVVILRKERLVTSLRPDLARIRQLVELGAPAAVQIVAEVGVFAVVTVLAGRLESRYLAAHQIALVVASYTFMVPLGIGSAAAVRVGHAIGRGDRQGAAGAGWAALSLGEAFMACSGLFLVTAPYLVARLFTPDREVVEAAIPLLACVAAFQIFDGLQCVVTGALRGAGDTRTPAVCHLTGYWGIGLPIGYVLCFRMQWGVTGLWAGLTVALILIGTILTVAWARATSSPRK